MQSSVTFSALIYAMKDFDSTGWYYEQYTAKWANELSSSIKGYPQYPQLPRPIVSSGVANPVTAIHRNP